MLSGLRVHALVICAVALCLSVGRAQTNASVTSGDDDPIQLFQQAQDAHQAGDLKRALELYERAISLRPEFPEAEYQRAAALMTLDRLPEAEKGLRRAIELQPEWSLPYTTLGTLLARRNQFVEAEKVLKHAIELDAENTAALVELTDVYLQMKAPRATLQAWLATLRGATERDRSSASVWAARSSVEYVLDEKTAAASSLDRALGLNGRSVPALMARARLRAEAGNNEGAVADALEAQRFSRLSPRGSPSYLSATLLAARIYAQAGKTDEALKTLDSLDETNKSLPEVVAMRTVLSKDCGASTADERAATEELLKQQPNNTSLLVCLGAALRTVDPSRSLELYRRAADIDPGNIRHVTGYAAALVQARRFDEAVIILRRILAVQPDNVTARSNLATALYELKRFPDALTEFNTLVKAKPELVVTYFFIATAHDFLGEYKEALAAYETFLARADALKNQLEIDKVNLRLPSLRNQVKRGEGVKKKKT
ncbi:MAG: hypothetical protein QOJ64_3466 [Acidobacteriota bacterium]|jgi:tetratricopeptide (TPR) repeat protein|nr:hypothetical protein [Acidobacteriota bacterium]